LLKAIELILTDPKTIREETLSLKRKYEKRYNGNRTTEEIEEYAADKIISNYSYCTAFIGGATALTGIIPGLGTPFKIDKILAELIFEFGP